MADCPFNAHHKTLLVFHLVCPVKYRRKVFTEGNELDNAVKYCPSGSVTVGLSKKDGKIILSIKDTGVGISEEDKKHLFTEGGRGKESLKVNVHSTGYGLYPSSRTKFTTGQASRRGLWKRTTGAFGPNLTVPTRVLRST